MSAELRRSGLKDVLARIRKEVPEVAEAEKRLGSRLVVARNVMHQRIMRGWTQVRLAEELGVSQPRVAEIEGANGNLKLDTLDALARVFCIPTSSLLKSGKPVPRRVAAEVSADGIQPSKFRHPPIGNWGPARRLYASEPTLSSELEHA